jgi:hypothetical protein
VQRRLKRLEHHPHAAAAAHLQYLIRSQPAELTGLVRRIEESSDGGPLIVGSVPRPGLVSIPPGPTRAAGPSDPGGRPFLAEGAGRVDQRVIRGGQLLQRQTGRSHSNPGARSPGPAPPGAGAFQVFPSQGVIRGSM